MRSGGTYRIGTVASVVVNTLVESVVVTIAVESVTVWVETVGAYVAVTFTVVLGLGAVVVDAVTPIQEHALKYQAVPEQAEA